MGMAAIFSLIVLGKRYPMFGYFLIVMICSAISGGRGGYYAGDGAGDAMVLMLPALWKYAPRPGSVLQPFANAIFISPCPGKHLSKSFARRLGGLHLLTRALRAAAFVRRW